MRKFFFAMVILIPSISYASCEVGSECKKGDFGAWAKSANHVLINNSFVCLSEEKTRNVGNVLIFDSPRNAYLKARSEMCATHQGWGYAEIISTSDDGKVHEIKYNKPLTNLILKGYALSRHVISFDDINNVGY